jgi:hypothetical protein
MDTRFRVHRPLKIIALNANGIGKHYFELSKQLHDRRIDVAFLTRLLTPWDRTLFENLIVTQFIKK